MRFRDREDAGRRLAEEVRMRDLGAAGVVVLGLPRGGVPVAFQIAGAIGAPLDVVIVRKLGVPLKIELAMGAIGEGGVRILNQEIVQSAGVSEDELSAVERRERANLQQGAIRFRGGHPPMELSGRAAVVVDDGMATGSTARAACQVARAHGAGRVVMAVPVASRSSISLLSEICEEVVCLEDPEPFLAVGEWYQDFSPTTDDEVVALMDRAATGQRRGHPR